MDKIKCTRCHSWKAVEDFGYKNSGKVYHNCFKCGEKRREYTQEKLVEKNEQTIVFEHVRKLLINDEKLEKYFIMFGLRKNRIMIEIPMD